LISRYLIEERREEILENYQLSIKELESGILTFTDDLSKLREKMIINGDYLQQFLQAFFQKANPETRTT